MNASSPDPDQRPDRDVRPIERHLQRLRPQPLAVDAASIVAAAENRSPGDPAADRPAPHSVFPAPPPASRPWSLAAVAISGFAAGILLTYVVMSRATDTTVPPVVTNPPVTIPSVAPGTNSPLASEAPRRPSIPDDLPPATSPAELAEASAPHRPVSWQPWPDANQTLFNTTTILAVRGSQPRNDLVGLSDGRSRLERQATPILQPTRYRGMGIPAGATPNQLLDELLGPL